MKAKAFVGVVVALLTTVAVSVEMTAQDTHSQPHQYHHYQLVDPGTFGGPQSGLQSPGVPRSGVVNNRGTLTGAADTLTLDPYCLGYPDCYAAHAFQLQHGVTTDLNVLPGGVASQVNWISASGLMTGVGDNGQPDPLSGGTLPQIHGLLWENGSMTDMGTLPEGGYISFPTAVNNRGEVVGNAQNTVADLTPMYSGDGTQTRAFYWKSGTMQDLGTLGTGTDAAAALINERGQVVGWSYINSVPSPVCIFSLTTDSFIWDKKNGMSDIGGLGGTCTMATDLNNRGQVVGVSGLPGDSISHPFIWDAVSGMTDLAGASSGDTSWFSYAPPTVNADGAVAGMACDLAHCYALLWRKTGGKWERTLLATDAFSVSINDSEQVIGYGNFPFLWEDGGPAVDLNTLVPPNSGVTLYEAVQINNRGEIAVQGPDANGNNHAVLLIPCDENHPAVAGCDYSMVDASTAAAQSAAPAMQQPAALAPGTRMLGMLNRFRSPLGRRAPGRGTAAVSSTQPVPSANVATTDWLGDHQLVPQSGSNPGYCEIQNGALNGTCVVVTGNNACTVSFSGCPSGPTASSGGSVICDGNSLPISTTACFSVPGFDVSTTALTPATVSAGGSATATLSVSAYDGYSGSVAFTCSVQPTATMAPTCSFSPSSVSAGTPTTLTISTTAPTSALRTGAGSGLFYAFFLSLSGLFAMVLRFVPEQKRRGKFAAGALACVLLSGVVFQAACGSSKPPTPGTPAGSYIVTVTGTDSSGTLANSIIMPPLTVQ